MSWLQKLYDTYEANVGRPAASGDEMRLLPVGHTPQQAHVEIVIDSAGMFQRASILDGIETIIPATEKSAARTMNEAPHPLCDKIQYVAKDYAERFGGKKKPYFNAYRVQLAAWCDSHPHAKAQAVLKYVSKGTVVADLIGARVLCADSHGTLLTTPPDGSAVPAIFRVLPKHPTKKDAGRPIQDQGDAFVRWRVEVPGVPSSGTWEDPSLVQSWASRDTDRKTEKGLCFATGASDDVVAETHPKRLRHGGDGARLISSNDGDG